MADNQFYTVIGSKRGILFGLEDTFDSVADAAKAIATEVNKKLKEHGVSRRVNVKSCYDGYTLIVEPNVVWEYRIIAHRTKAKPTKKNA